MYRYLIIVVVLCGMHLNAQEKSELSKEESGFIFGTNLSLGLTLLPDKGRGLNFGFEFKNKSLFGFGVLLSSGSYDALNLNQNPPLDAIENYDPETDDPFTGLKYIEGNTKDRIMVNTFYLSKGYHLNKNSIVDIQVGPSFNIFRRQKYTYRYNPPFGSFSGSSPSSFFAKSAESKLLNIGLNLRGCVYYSFGTNTVLSLAPYLNINKETNVIGLQLGFIFGKKFKRNMFQN